MPYAWPFRYDWQQDYMDILVENRMCAPYMPPILAMTFFRKRRI